MNAIQAASTGLKRAIAWPMLLSILWLANFLVALPAAIVLGSTIQKSVGKSEAGERLLDGFDMGWHGEFSAATGGLEDTFRPPRLTGGGWLENLDSWWSVGIFGAGPEVSVFGALFALLWILLSGGVLAHFRRPPNRVSLGGFLSDGGSFFFRYLRLAVLSAPLYYGVYKLARWIFPRIDRATTDVTVEKTVLTYNLLAAALVVLFVVTIKATFDYAKIAMVVEERKSALLAAFRGLGFVIRRPLKVFGLVGIFGGLGLLWLAIYQLVGPGSGLGSLTAILAVFVLGQVFLLVRLALRLGLLGGEMALFEAEAE